ncbi:MAG: hypothetical protein SP1CHLAM54_11490 [Chlamydiia bacterium]|nr:hypothetical protein [Chlamydiia bacterium]MCH9616052.1 hypothetical protein [Chlamydiia bacterium]MCH9629075.1 hypothetical protein [Chlamydiia bacterium]
MNTQTLTKKLTLHPALEAVAGAAFIGLLAQVSVPLPFGTVPFSLLNAAMLFLCMQFGAKRSFYMIATYIVGGALGIALFPMISSVAGIGFMRLIGPHGGYYLGFILLPFLMGALYNKTDGIIKRSLAGMAGMLLILTLGTAYLSFFIGLKAAFFAGFVPFFVVDMLKAIGLAAVTKSR